MRIKKRAKSVSFGKSAKEAASNAVEKEEKKVATSNVANHKKTEEHKTEHKVEHKAEHKKEEHHKEAAEHKAASNAVKEEESKKEEKKDEAASVLSESKDSGPRFAVASAETSQPKDDLEAQLKGLREPADSASEASTTPEKINSPASLSQEAESNAARAESDSVKEELKKEAPLSIAEEKIEEKVEAPKEEPKEEPKVAVSAPVSHDAPKAEEKPSPIPELPKDAPNPFVKKQTTDPFMIGTKDLYEKPKHPIRFFIVVAVVSFVLGLAVMAGVYYGFEDVRKMQLPGIAAQPTATPVPTKEPAPKVEAEESKVKEEEPTAAPKEEVALSEYTVRVLNGSGVKGEAAKVKTQLTTAGFKVVSTGNADSTDYIKTEISVKKTVSKEALTALQTELEKTYKTSTSTATSQTTDIVVIIGSAK